MNRKLRTEELSRIKPDVFKESHKFDVVVILDNIRSGNNVGSVFRTADAFRLAAIYLCGITAQPPQRDIQKTALGATETMNLRGGNVGIGTNNPQELLHLYKAGEVKQEIESFSLT